MNRRSLIMAGGAVTAVVAWYAFRPERLFIDQKVSEGFPVAQAAAGRADASKILVTGRFHSGAHETKGTATIHELPDGKKVLRLTHFKTSNGPQVHVYLVAAEDAKDNATVKNAGFIDVAPLKGNVGDQNYELPAGVDLQKYRAVTIWCQRFGVNFGTAPLMPAESAGASAAPDGSPTALFAGRFHSGAHQTKGTATIYQLADGKRVLRLTDFTTSDGPQLHVYLVAAEDAKDNVTVKKAGFVDIGPLKGNVGDQNYELPSDVDLEKYRAVTIWCQRFSVNFGTAPLMPQAS